MCCYCPSAIGAVAFVASVVASAVIFILVVIVIAGAVCFLAVAFFAVNVTVVVVLSPCNLFILMLSLPFLNRIENTK